MRAIVGLGNPGRGYAATRHNAGFLLADALAEHWRFPPFRRAGRADVAEGTVAGQPVVLLKPRTYMNASGAALAPLLAEPAFAPAHDLLVLVDDVALPLGTFRLRARGSAGGHHGLESIEDALQSRIYGRLRIGIGPAPPGLDDLADFVLAPLTGVESATLRDIAPAMVDAAACWVADGVATAMNRFNRRG